MRIGYLECFAGVSGDMLLGALVDAGVPFPCLEEAAAALNVGARLEMRKVSRGGLAGTKVDVIAPDEKATEPAQAHEEHSAHSHETHTHEAHSSAAPLEHRAHAHAHTHDAHRPLSRILDII